MSQSAGDIEVVWQSPANGDVYATGDTIVGSWNTVQGLVSPSFQLCRDSNAGGNNTKSSSSDAAICGMTVWPTLDNNGSITSVDLAVPNISTTGAFYLTMKDDAGDLFYSPSFSLSPNKTSAVAQLPSSLLQSSTVLPSATAASAMGTDTGSSGPPAAAIAVPLSLCGALLLTALAVIFRRRKVKNRAPIPAVISPPAPPIPVALPMQNANASYSFSSEKNPAYMDRYTSPIYVPPPIYAGSRHREEELEPCYTRRKWEEVQRFEEEKARERRLRREWEDTFERERERDRLSRRQTWRDWISHSRLRRESEYEREMEYDREVEWQRYKMDRERQMERERQTELEWWEERERRKRRVLSHRRRDDDYGYDYTGSRSRPRIFRSGASRSTHRSGYLSSRASSSPTRVGTAPPSLDLKIPVEELETPVTAEVVERYSRRSPSTLHGSIRSRPHSHLSHGEAIDERPLFLRRDSRDIYDAIERVVARRYAAS